METRGVSQIDRTVEELFCIKDKGGQGDEKESPGGGGTGEKGKIFGERDGSSGRGGGSWGVRLRCGI